MQADQLVEKLNKALNDPDFDQKSFQNLLDDLITQHRISVRLVDFASHGEAQLQKATHEKMVGVESQNYDWAASWRDKEERVLKYLRLKQELGIEKSCFHLEEDELFYLFLGNGKNDSEIKELVMKGIGVVG